MNHEDFYWTDDTIFGLLEHYKYSKSISKVSVESKASILHQILALETRDIVSLSSFPSKTHYNIQILQFNGNPFLILPKFR